MEQSDEEVLAPENFSMVEPGIYRSAFPRSKNQAFLLKLKLKSVIPLVPEEYPQVLVEFYLKNSIRLLPFGFDGNKWPFKRINDDLLGQALLAVLDPKNHPCLIHCNRGKHRTGSIIGCLRKYRGWSLSSIFAEYIMFASPKDRLEDQRFIEEFDVEKCVNDIDEESEETCDTSISSAIS